MMRRALLSTFNWCTCLFLVIWLGFIKGGLLWFVLYVTIRVAWPSRFVALAIAAQSVEHRAYLIRLWATERAK